MGEFTQRVKWYMYDHVCACMAVKTCAERASPMNNIMSITMIMSISIIMMNTVNSILEDVTVCCWYL